MKSNDARASAEEIPKQKTFLDIRKQLYQRDQQQMVQYQQSFQRGFQEEMGQIQMRHEFLIQQMHNMNSPLEKMTQSKNKSLQFLNDKSKTSQGHRRIHNSSSSSSNPQAISINTIQYLNNSSLRNTKTSQDKRYNGNDKFFQSYVTPTSQQLAKQSQDGSNQRNQLFTPQYQTFVPGGTQHIQSTQIKPLSMTSQTKLFNPSKFEQGRPISMEQTKRRILSNLNFIDGNNKDEGYADYKSVEINQLSKHIMFNTQSSKAAFNKRNMHTDKAYFNHHMSRHGQIPQFKNTSSITGQSTSDTKPLSKETEDQIKKIAQKVCISDNDQFFLFSVAKSKDVDPNAPPQESEYEKTRKNIKKSKSTKNLDIPLRDLLIQDPKNKDEQDRPMFYLNLQTSVRNTWKRSKNQIDEMIRINGCQIEDFKNKRRQHSGSVNLSGFNSIFQTQIDQETYKVSRHILVVEIYNLQNVKTHLNLKYCYQYIPQITFNTLEVQEIRDFKEFKKHIMKKLRITSDNIYLYHKDGTPVYTHRQLRSVDLTIFAANCRTFAGIEKIFSTEANLSTLKKTIEKLESKIKIPELTIPQNSIRIDMGLIQEIPSNMNSPKSTPLMSKQGSRIMLNRNNSMSVSSKNQTPKSNLNRSQDTKAAKRSQFADFVGKDDEDDKQKKLFFEDELLEDDNNSNAPEKEIVDVNTYIKKIMKYLDLFFSKFDYNWRVDKEKEEIDLYLKYQLTLPKRIKKSKMLDFKLKGFEQRKTNLEKLKRLNRDLFASNIGKTLQEYELSENDLNSVYLLYRSILNIQSQLISMENVIKEDDIMLRIDKFDFLTQENKEFVESLCNYQQIINWENFVKMLKNISNLDDQKKIEMFVQVFDSDNSGTLSIDEISHFAKLTLECIINEDKYPGFIKLLQDYFTKLLFTSLREEGKQEIPMDKIKKAILEGNENSDILCFFCGTEAPES